jgi:hypothetical protein
VEFLNDAKVGLKLLTECLIYYIEVTDILDSRDTILVERVSRDIVKRNASL